MRLRPRVALPFALVAVLIAIAALPVAAATPTATEEVISVLRIERQPNALNIVNSRLIIPPGARWESDLAAGPMTFTVERGAVSVVLGGGQARIERQPDPLMGEGMHPLTPGRATALWPGDRLEIVSGYRLQVSNDEDVPAEAIMMRLRATPKPTQYGDQDP